MLFMSCGAGITFKSIDRQLKVFNMKYLFAPDDRNMGENWVRKKSFLELSAKHAILLWR